MTIRASDPGHRGNSTAQDDPQRVNRAIVLLSLAAFASAAALRPAAAKMKQTRFSIWGIDELVF